MSRMYTVATSGAVTAAVDLLEVIAADDKSVRLRGFSISQTSDVGDAAEENLEISVKRFSGAYTGGSGGSAPTPSLIDSADTAAAFATEVRNTTQASGGTSVTLISLGWNERASPFEWWAPGPEFAPVGKQSEALVVTITAPADSVTIQTTFWLEEL